MTDAVINGCARPEPAVVIHIGWHKSASTFLQKGFFSSIDANYQPLAAFPAGQSHRASHAASLIDLVESWDNFDPMLLRELLAGEPGRDLTIISHEEISGHPHGYALIDPFVTARNLAAAFPNARIIAITRNQIDYILSLYCYRVAVRGHESRSLSRFVREDMASGLSRHLQYDRVIGEYIRLFGAGNVLVLPVEMLRADSPRFFERLVGFIGRAPSRPFEPAMVNESTRQAYVLALWRPMNAAFAAMLRVMLLMRGESPRENEPHVRKIYPFMRLRYRYYAFKRQVTALLKRRIPNARCVGADDLPDRHLLEADFAVSNARLQALAEIDWDMASYGYVLPASP